MKRQSLVQMLLSPILAGALVSCDVPQDYNSSSNETSVRRTTRQTQSKTQWVLENNCVNPKVILRGNDPGFSSLTDINFVISRQDERGVADYNDIRWTYYRGETMVVTVIPTPNLRNRKLNFVIGCQTNRNLGCKNKDPVGEAFFQAVNVSKLLDQHGAGDYQVAIGFDGKMACLMYLRVKER